RFLPALEAEGLIERLGEVILDGALSALKRWDEAGLIVPTVAINVSDAELRNPKFCDRIRWELDRHEIPADRLTIEILETVTSEGDVDVVAHNLRGLARLGCRIDMDDFGTGNASLAALRRFSVDRIKIDRSYVSEVDSDQNQQSMVAAIVTMAEQLDLETLAEGVETEGEHAMVAQLGCRYVQGYGIARPMSAEACREWLAKFEADNKASTLPELKATAHKPVPRRGGNGKTA
ncbi:MAG: EAL domain-containing protein, partial [Pseudomonadota bacterium]